MIIYLMHGMVTNNHFSIMVMKKKIRKQMNYIDFLTKEWMKDERKEDKK